MKFRILSSVAAAALLCSSMFGAAAHANESRECRVVTVNEDNNVWEEGLGVYGKSDEDSQMVGIEFDRAGKLTEISVGQMSWEKGPGTKLSEKTLRNAAKSYTAATKEEQITVIVYGSARGVVLRKESADRSLKTVATIDCLRLDYLVQASVGQANVKRMTATEVKRLPAAVKSRMNETDIPVELGDGYYDLKELVTYKVVLPTGVVVGYLEHARLSFTEGDDVEVYVRYDRNGLRHGEIEQL